MNEYKEDESLIVITVHQGEVNTPYLLALGNETVHIRGVLFGSTITIVYSIIFLYM